MFGFVAFLSLKMGNSKKFVLISSQTLVSDFLTLSPEGFLWFSIVILISGEAPPPSVFAPPPLSYHICIRTLIPSISSVFILKSTPVKKKKLTDKAKKTMFPRGA